MISKFRVSKFCRKGQIEKIENYEQAINSDEVWDCHHRDEIRVLPSGMVVFRTREELKEAGRYFDCPPEELIFLSHKEHAKLHGSYLKEFYKVKNIKRKKQKPRSTPSRTGFKRSEEFCRKCAERMIGTHPSEETRAKMRAAKLGKPSTRKGVKLSEETKEKLRQANLGKKHSPEEIQKMRDAQLKRWAEYRAAKEGN